MNEAQAVAAIRAYFEAEWGGLTAVLFDDDPSPVPAEQTWVRLNIRHSLGDQVTMGSPGNNRHELQGGLTVQVFQPQGQHSVDARIKAVTAAEIFRGKIINGIHFYQTTPREIGNDGHGFYQINVNVQFRYSIFA